jgi:hypothetical protein
LEHFERKEHLKGENNIKIELRGVGFGTVACRISVHGKSVVNTVMILRVP